MAEKDFEENFIQALKKHKWEEEVLEYPKHHDLLKNWQKILYDHNKDCIKKPLNDAQMQEILSQIQNKTPFEIHRLLEGGSVALQQEGISKHLKIFDTDIGLGNTRYQIARQPWFGEKWEREKKRGDISLLINGLPLVHIELKNRGVSLDMAFKQIKDYAKEGAFKGLFKCIQLFVCATPEKIKYFSNFGGAQDFKKEFCFEWADENNEPIQDYKEFIKRFLSVDFIHTFISHYMIADSSNQSLKAMRPYQCYAVQAILKSAEESQISQDNKGGYVWHTTGSGKTLTSFKSATLLLHKKMAKKVVFLADRRELVLQTLQEYKKADTGEVVQDSTSMSAAELATALKDKREAVLIATLQTMYRIQPNKAFDKQKIIFIVDEAHRSTFGNAHAKENDSLGMLKTIKDNFKNALFIGFTGTPKTDKTSKLNTADIFGKELHRYTLAHGMKDKMVLRFYVSFANTMPKLRHNIATMKATERAKNEGEGARELEYKKWLDKQEITHKDLEAQIKPAMFNKEHKEQVVGYILDNHARLSQKRKFHAIFATSSIPDALEYYKIFKEHDHPYKITAMFDPSDNATTDKRAGIEAILNDYNHRFECSFTFENYHAFQKDVAQRLAHRGPYANLDTGERLDLVIVVDQMLTGFDSLFVNTLYLDKILEGANLIQALSRTNRVFDRDKPFGNIIFLRKYATMKDNLEEAVKVYADGADVDTSESKLTDKVKQINALHHQIQPLLVTDQELKDTHTQNQFNELFKKLARIVRNAQIQGLKWDQKEYCLSEEEQELLGTPKEVVFLELDEETFRFYLQKYKEIANNYQKRTRERGVEDPGFEIDYDLIEQDEGMLIDYAYIEALLKEKNQEKLDRYLQTLEPEDREFFLHHLPTNWQEIGIEACRVQYKQAKQDKKIEEIVQAVGVDRTLLKEAMAKIKTEKDLDREGNLFDKLEASADLEVSRVYFEAKEGKALSKNEVVNAVWAYLREVLTTP
ncbi:type I restriction endonuclease subunit R [Helicobacter bizzozeronii]|uniref:type I restriction endonuclease subunit R n=1 Tax=Helicobacter bizzozeronii TaxID=56877 RepID=UPI000CF19C63|nr:HsdR family type I site-specific deoxyribonuclease [Helicobacter bizzozeronii]